MISVSIQITRTKTTAGAISKEIPHATRCSQLLGACKLDVSVRPAYVRRGITGGYAFTRNQGPLNTELRYF